SMSIKISDRKGLHPAEQVISQMTHCSLADVDHDTVVSKRSDNPDSHDACQTDQIRCETTEIICTVPEHRSYIVIHQSLWECGPDHCCDSGDKDTEDNK